MGPPQKLIMELATEFHVKDFVETGTFYGGTAVWASNIFERVYTIENSKEMYEAAVNNHQDKSNIKFLLGDSRTHLKKVVSQLEKPAVFWLDAHWSGGLTYGDNDQCPLLEEIDVINSSPLDHFILIDDARLFLSSPQPPHNVEQWPTISELIFALKTKFPDRFIVIIEDVIIATPAYSKSAVSAYCQNINSKAWEEYSKATKKSNLQKGFDLIVMDLKTQARRMVSRLKKRVSANSR